MTPILIELTLWSKNNIQEFNPNLNLDENLDKVEKDKEPSYAMIKENYQNFKTSLFQ